MSEKTSGRWRAPVAPWQAIGARDEDDTSDFSARRSGRAAFRSGHDRSMCPYNAGTRARVDWLSGWWAENNGVESDT